MADFVFPMPGSSPTPVKPPKPGPRLKPIPVVRNGKPVTATEVNKEKKKKTDADKEISMSDVYSSLAQTPTAGTALLKAAPAGLGKFVKEVSMPTERISREEAEAAGRFSPKSLLRGIQGLPVVGLAFSEFGGEMMDSLISTGKSALEVTSFGQVSFSKDDSNSYRNTLARGESLLPKMVEDAGNISIALHGVGAGLGRAARGAAAGTARGVALGSAAETITRAGVLADKFGALPITLPFKAAGKVGRMGTQYGRNYAATLRAEGTALYNADPNSAAARTKFNKANTWERFSGREFIDANGKKIIIEPGFVNRFAKRAVFNASKNNTEIINTMLGILDNPLFKDEPNPNKPGENWGSLSDLEQQAVISTYSGRAQEIQKIAEITGLPVETIAHMGRYNFDEGYSLLPEGARLAADFVNHTDANPTMSPQQYARLADAADRLRIAMGNFSDQARAGYGRAEPLPAAYDVPTPDPALLLAELEKIGHPLAEVMARAMADMPEAGGFRLSENPKDPTRIAFLKWVIEHAPDAVALNESIYPPAMRGNIVFYKRVRHALNTEAARMVGGTPPADGSGVGSAPPKPGSFDPNSGLPTPESLTEVKEPGTLAKFPVQYIQNTMTQLDRLRGTQKRVATKLANIILKIADKERIGLQLQLKLQNNEARILLQRAKVAKLTALYEKMKADQADSIVREGKIYTEEQLAAELEAENTALESLNDDTVGLEAAADELIDELDALEDEAVATGEQLDREGGDSLAIEKAVEADRAKFPESQVAVDLQQQLEVLQEEYDVITADLEIYDEKVAEIEGKLAALTPPIPEAGPAVAGGGPAITPESIKKTIADPTGDLANLPPGRRAMILDLLENAPYVPPVAVKFVTAAIDKLLSKKGEGGLLATRGENRGAIILKAKGKMWYTNGYIMTVLPEDSWFRKKIAELGDEDGIYYSQAASSGGLKSGKFDVNKAPANGESILKDAEKFSKKAPFAQIVSSDVRTVRDAPTPKNKKPKLYTQKRVLIKDANDVRIEIDANSLDALLAPGRTMQIAVKKLESGKDAKMLVVRENGEIVGVAMQLKDFLDPYTFADQARGVAGLLEDSGSPKDRFNLARAANAIYDATEFGPDGWTVKEAKTTKAAPAAKPPTAAKLKKITKLQNDLETNLNLRDTALQDQLAAKAALDEAQLNADAQQQQARLSPPEQTAAAEPAFPKKALPRERPGAKPKTTPVAVPKTEPITKAFPKFIEKFANRTDLPQHVMPQEKPIVGNVYMREYTNSFTAHWNTFWERTIARFDETLNELPDARNPETGEFPMWDIHFDKNITLQQAIDNLNKFKDKLFNSKLKDDYDYKLKGGTYSVRDFERTKAEIQQTFMEFYNEFMAEFAPENVTSVAPAETAPPTALLSQVTDTIVAEASQPGLSQIEQPIDPVADATNTPIQPTEGQLSAPVKTGDEALDSDNYKYENGLETFDTGVRKYGISSEDAGRTPVSKTTGRDRQKYRYVVRRIASDGAPIESTRQVFGTKAAARTYIAKLAAEDATFVPTIQPEGWVNIKPSRELGPGPSTMPKPPALLAAEARLSKLEETNIKLKAGMDTKAAQIDELRVKEAAERAKLSQITPEIATREALLGTQMITQPEVRAAGPDGQPTGRMLTAGETGAATVGQPPKPGQVPRMAGNAVGGVLRPIEQVVRREPLATTGPADFATPADNAAMSLSPDNYNVPEATSIKAQADIVQAAANEALIMRGASMPPSMPLIVALAMGADEFGQIGPGYLPSGKPSGKTSPLTYETEQGATAGFLKLPSEYFKPGNVEEIYDFRILARRLSAEQLLMDSNETFRALMLTKVAVTPEQMIGEERVRELYALAEKQALMLPASMEGGIEGGIAAYAEGVFNRDANLARKTAEFFGQMLDAEMKIRGFETLPIKGDIRGTVRFDVIDGKRPYLPKYAREQVINRTSYINPDIAVEVLNKYLSATKKTTSIFKDFTLPLSVQWQIGDIIGMFVSAAATGVNPLALAEEMNVAFKNNYGGGWRDAFKKEAERRVNQQGKKLSSSGLQNVGLRVEEKQRLSTTTPGSEDVSKVDKLPVLGKVKAGARWYKERAYMVNDAINNVGRQAYFMAKLEQALNKLNKMHNTKYTVDDVTSLGLDKYNPRQSFSSVEEQLVHQDIAKAWEDTLDTANEVMGDWNDLSPWERKYVLPHATFYAWIKHINKLFIKIAKENPKAIIWQMYLGQLAYDPDTDPLGLLAGNLRLPGAGITSTNFANPFADTADLIGGLTERGTTGAWSPDLSRVLGMASPMPRMLFAGATGLNLSSMTPLSRQSGEGIPNKFGSVSANDLAFAIRHPGQFASYAAQQFPLIPKLMDIAPTTRLPLTGTQLGPYQRYDTGGPRLIPGRQDMTPKYGGRLVALARLLTIPGTPASQSQDAIEERERLAQERTRAYINAQRDR